MTTANKRFTGGVLQQWVIERCSWREQTTMLTGLRGSDVACPDVKPWVRWIRATVLNDARSNESFMKVNAFDLPSMSELARSSYDVFGGMSVHFLAHLMHTLEVIGYRHPDPHTKHAAFQAYSQICDALHVNIETEAQMSTRLADGVEER